MMREEMKIIKASTKDIREIVSLVRESFDEEYLIPSIYRGRGVEFFLNYELENAFSPYCFFVAIEENDVIGYCEFKDFYPNIFLNLIAISKDSKGKGVGSLFFDFFISYFNSKKYQSIMLDVFESNSIAIDWYNNLGFQKLFSKNLIKIDIPVNEIHLKYQILNYPQLRVEMDNFGFSIIKVKLEDSIYEYGIIDKSLFARNAYTLLSEEIGCSLIQKLKLDTFYLYTSDNEITKHGQTAVDHLLRKDLKI